MNMMFDKISSGRDVATEIFLEKHSIVVPLSGKTHQNIINSHTCQGITQDNIW